MMEGGDTERDELETLRRRLETITSVAVDVTIRPADPREAALERMETPAWVPEVAKRPLLSVAPPDAPAPSRAEGDIQIQGLIATGGMGQLYLAEQQCLGREVVLKTVKDPRDVSHVMAVLTEKTIRARSSTRTSRPCISSASTSSAGPSS